jgi:hypothetical protein
MRQIGLIFGLALGLLAAAHPAQAQFAPAGPYGWGMWGQPIPGWGGGYMPYGGYWQSPYLGMTPTLGPRLGYYSPVRVYPWYGYGPGYGNFSPNLPGAPVWYGPGYPPGLTSPAAAPQVPVPPTPGAPTPPLGTARSTPDGQYYLEIRPEFRPAGGPDALLRQQIRVQKGEDDVYRVRWLGSPRTVKLLELRSLDANGNELDSARIEKSPFEGRLRVPREAATVVVRVEGIRGADTAYGLPAAQFRELAVVPPAPKPQPKPKP